MPRRNSDSRTLDLFAIPTAPPMVSGAQNISIEIRHLLADVLKACPRSRYQVAARMSEFLGIEISKHQLDSWKADSRDSWRFPLEYLVAFEMACDTFEVTQYISAKRGCGLLVGEEILEARRGRLQTEHDERARQIKLLKKRLGGQS